MKAALAVAADTEKLLEAKLATATDSLKAKADGAAQAHTEVRPELTPHLSHVSTRGCKGKGGLLGWMDARAPACDPHFAWARGDRGSDGAAPAWHGWTRR